MPLLLAKSALFLFWKQLKQSDVGEDICFSNRFFCLLFILSLCFSMLFLFLNFDIFLGTHVHSSVNVQSDVKEKIDVSKASKTTLRFG